MEQAGGGRDKTTQADTWHGRLARRKAAGMGGVDANQFGAGDAAGSGAVDVDDWLREVGNVIGVVTVGRSFTVVFHQHVRVRGKERATNAGVALAFLVDVLVLCSE